MNVPYINNIDSMHTQSSDTPHSSSGSAPISYAKDSKIDLTIALNDRQTTTSSKHSYKVTPFAYPNDENQTTNTTTDTLKPLNTEHDRKEQESEDRENNTNNDDPNQTIQIPPSSKLKEQRCREEESRIIIEHQQFCSQQPD